MWKKFSLRINLSISGKKCVGMGCDFDIRCSSISTNFVKHRTSIYWIIKRKPNIYVLTRGWVMQFLTLLLGWVSHFCAEGRGWAMCFLSTTFPNAPAHPHLYFMTSPLQYESLTVMKNIRKIQKGYMNVLQSHINESIHLCSSVRHQ